MPDYLRRRLHHSPYHISPPSYLAIHILEVKRKWLLINFPWLWSACWQIIYLSQALQSATMLPSSIWNNVKCRSILVPIPLCVWRCAFHWYWIWLLEKRARDSIIYVRGQNVIKSVERTIQASSGNCMVSPGDLGSVYEEIFSQSNWQFEPTNKLMITFFAN
jgi:hypothetical protein